MTARNGTVRRLSAIVLIALTAGVGCLTAPTSSAAQDDPGKLLLVLDASGSMKGKDPSGTTKIVAAKKALTSVVGSLPADANVGLRVYGATQPGGKPTPAACADTQLVAPIGPLDKPGLTTAINGVQAKGETPIAHSLEQALRDLGTSGKRNIVLVSDGEESCVPDPCPAVKKIVGAGVDLQIDTVGFGVNAKARSQLRCLADAGHGTYYDARNADQLMAGLTTLSQRALRPFTLSGTPITGSPDEATAPRMAPGQYLDRFTVGGGAKLFRLDRTAGSTVRVAFTAKPPASQIGVGNNFVLALRTVSHTRCDAAFPTPRGDQRTFPMFDTLLAEGYADARSAERREPCATEPLVLEVTRTKGAAGATPVELVFIEEPPVTSVATLPPGIADADVPVLAPGSTGPVRPVVGGGSFSDAATLTPGSYSDSFLEGEHGFYRVRLDWGQQLGVTVEAPADPRSASDYSGSRINLRMWGPDRTWLFEPSSARLRASDSILGGAATKVGQFTSPIHYRNRDAGMRPNQRSMAIPGYYYFAVYATAMGDQDRPMPARINVAVSGSKQPAPYAATAPVTSPDTSAPALGPSSSNPAGAAPPRGRAVEQTSVLPLVGGGLIALAVLGALGWVVLRRRSPRSR